MDKRKVLLIQPDEDLTSLVKEFLGRTDFDVYTAHNGLDGLEIASEKNPHIVLIDLELDGQPEGGYSLGKSFRNDKGLEKAPLVLIMPDDDEKTSGKYEAFKKVFDGFLYKPLLDTELKRVVENFTGFGETGDKVIEQLDGLMTEDDPDVKGLVEDLKKQQETKGKKKAKSREPAAKAKSASTGAPEPKHKSPQTVAEHNLSTKELAKKVRELRLELDKKDERVKSLLEQLSDLEMDHSFAMETLESENEQLKKSRDEAIALLEKAKSKLKT